MSEKKTEMSPNSTAQNRDLYLAEEGINLMQQTFFHPRGASFSSSEQNFCEICLLILIVNCLLKSDVAILG